MVMAIGAEARAEEPAYTCKVVPANQKVSVSFARETTVLDLATWITGLTCKNVVFSAQVPKRAAKLTVIASGPMTPRQAVQLFVDSLEASGLVVVQKRDTFVVKLGKDHPVACPDVADAGSVEYPSPAPEVVDELQKAIDEGIRVVNETTRDIDKSLIEKVLANPMAFVKGARVVPAMKDGKPQGFKLYAIRPNSVYAKLGFSNGDTIISVNGFELTSADKALEVYTKLREAKHLEIALLRRGKPVKLTFRIK